MVPAARAIAPIAALVDESLDEAEYLWGAWEAELVTPARDLDGVASSVERRLFGSLDGVRVGLDAAMERLLWPAALEGEGPRATAAAHLLATATEPAAQELLVQVIGGAPPARHPFIRRAIELAHSAALLRELERRIPKLAPGFSRALMEACAFQRTRPPSLIVDELTSADPSRIAAAVGALRCAPPDSARRPIRAALRSEHAKVVEAGIEVGLIHGDAEAWEVCSRLASGAVPAAQARLLVALLAPAHQQTGLGDALGSGPTRKEALFALGFAGTRAAAELALSAMGDPELAALAGEAFSAITGLDLEAQGLTIARVEVPADIAFEEEDLDADLRPTEDELLPLPDSSQVAAWWRTHAGRYEPGVRYLRGRPVDMAVLCTALQREPMRRRHAIALELAVRTHGHLQLQTRTFAREQRRQMCAVATADLAARSPLSTRFSSV